MINSTQNSLDDSNGLCKQCGHDFNAHLVITPDVSNPVNGVIKCPAPGCKCHHDWDLENENQSETKK